MSPIEPVAPQAWRRRIPSVPPAHVEPFPTVCHAPNSTSIMKPLKTILLLPVLLLANSVFAGSIETGQTVIVPGVSMAGVSLGPNGRQELKKLPKPDRIDVGMSQSRQVWKWVRPEGRAETFFIHAV